MAKILIVEDEPKALRLLEEHLVHAGYQVSPAPSYEGAIPILEQQAIDLVITDLRLPGRSGSDLVEWISQTQPGLPVIVVTAYGSVADAVRLMRLGVVDYLEKPFDLDALSTVVGKTLDMVSLKAEHSYLLSHVREEEEHPILVGSSRAMLQVRSLISRVAASRSTVLVTGESGTGKELVALAIHDAASERKKPLIRVNCPNLSPQLIESELFGHMKGAFTGANETRKGKFELASGGTILLDEIAEIPLEMQPKLLRVLEERNFHRVGGADEVHVDVRVVAATNRNLSKMAEQGRFRDDLYYRLTVFPIHLPPLRERLDDIDELVPHLLAHLSVACSIPRPSITAAALTKLKSYTWPGNVRELRNVLERALLLCGGTRIDESHLTLHRGCALAEAPGSVETGPLVERVRVFKTKLIVEALRKTGWSKKDAAELLGLTQRAMSHYVVKYDLDRHREEFECHC
jgi:two-component system NtrC family response regulator